MGTSAIDISFPMIDFLSVRVQLSYKIFSVLYIPNKLSVIDYAYFREYLCTMEYFDIEDRVYFVGDFDAPNFAEYNVSDSKSLFLFSLMINCNFVQNNVKNIKLRTLDLVFRLYFFHDDLPFVQEDIYHPALNIFLPNIFTTDFVPYILNKVYNFRRGNYQLLYCDVSSID